MQIEKRKIAFIGEILISLNKITLEQVREALNIQSLRYPDKPLGEILKNLGYITDEDITTALAIQFLFPFINLKRYKLNKEIINLLSKDFIYKYKLIPLDKFGRIITLGMVNPLDVEAINMVEKITNLKVRVFFINKSDLEEIISLI